MAKSILFIFLFCSACYSQEITITERSKSEINKEADIKIFGVTDDKVYYYKAGNDNLFYMTKADFKKNISESLIKGNNDNLKKAGEYLISSSNAQRDAIFVTIGTGLLAGIVYAVTKDKNDASFVNPLVYVVGIGGAVTVIVEMINSISSLNKAGKMLSATEDK